MSSEETHFKDLHADELDKLKDIYVASRINSMTATELQDFVKVSIEDQIKGTVGPQEEKEAWLEMKEHFKDDFEEKVLSVRKGGVENLISPELEEFEKRKGLLEKRKAEQDSANQDMW